MPRLVALVLALSSAGFAGPLLAQPTDACGPSAPLLTLNVPMDGDNSNAQTDAFLSSAPCGGFTGSGGVSDVFVRFIPPTTGVYRFATCGSAADTVVSIHTSSPANDDNLVGCNDDDCDSQSRIDVRLTAGHEYYVRIASNGDTFITGPFTVLATQLTPPTNDECSGAITIAPGSSTPGTNENATGASIGCVTDGKDVWYALPVSVGGVYVIDTYGGEHPDPVVSVWTACDGGGTLLACNDNDGFSFNARAAVYLQSGSTYLVRVSGRRGFSGQPAEGNFILNVSSPVTIVTNDRCDAAAPIGPSQTLTGATTNTTLNTFSAGCGDNDFYDVWYALNVPARAQYVVSLHPTGDFDAVLSAMDGCNGEAAELACSNQFGDESLAIVGEPGQPILLRVAGQYHARGEFTITVDGGTPIPANDECAQAISIGLGQATGTTRAATGTDITLNCAGEDVADVWYRFTAPAAGLFTFDTALSTELTDTSLALFNSCDEEPLACNDNAGANANPSDFTSSVSLAMTSGQQVLVRVAGANRTVGDFVLRASGPTAAPGSPDNDDCDHARAITGLAFSDAVDARFAHPDLASECNFGIDGTYYGVWYVYNAPEHGVLTVTQTGPMSTVLTAFTGGCGALSPLYPLQCGEITMEVAAGDTLYFLVGTAGFETPAAPYILTATLRPQLGCCVSGAGCQIVPMSQCTGTWSESLCGPGTTLSGLTNLPLLVPNPPTNNTPTFVTSTLQMNDDVTLTNISVSVNLTHTAGADVVLRVITPWGATIPLLTGANGPSSFESGDYIFSDIGLRTMSEVNDGGPMPHRTYPAPSAIGPVVAGHSALGTWTLSVGDDRRSNATGRVDSWNITFHGSCGCPADVGAAGGLPGSDGQLNNNDFIAFISYFFAGDPHADMGIPGGLPGHDGQFDNNDFIAFISAFFNGCS